jgi:hypothetical protein
MPLELRIWVLTLSVAVAGIVAAVVLNQARRRVTERYGLRLLTNFLSGLVAITLGFVCYYTLVMVSGLGVETEGPHAIWCPPPSTLQSYIALLSAPSGFVASLLNGNRHVA